MRHDARILLKTRPKEALQHPLRYVDSILEPLGGSLICALEKLKRLQREECRAEPHWERGHQLRSVGSVRSSLSCVSRSGTELKTVEKAA